METLFLDLRYEVIEPHYPLNASPRGELNDTKPRILGGLDVGHAVGLTVRQVSRTRNKAYAKNAMIFFIRY